MAPLAPEVLDRPVDLKKYEPPKTLPLGPPAPTNLLAWKDRIALADREPVVREGHRKLRPKRSLFPPRGQGSVLRYPRGFVEDNPTTITLEVTNSSLVVNDDRFTTRNRYDREIARGKELGESELGPDVA